jgi:hypothetical protein
MEMVLMWVIYHVTNDLSIAYEGYAAAFKLNEKAKTLVV